MFSGYINENYVGSIKNKYVREDDKIAHAILSMINHSRNYVLSLCNKVLINKMEIYMLELYKKYLDLKNLDEDILLLVRINSSIQMAKIINLKKEFENGK